MPSPDAPARRWPVDPLTIGWLLLPTVVWISHGFHNQLARDPSFWVYAGQLVAAGEPPYVALMNRTGPLAHLLPGLGVWLGEATGLGDVVGVRVLFFGLAAATPLIVYLIVRTCYGSRLAGSVAAAALLSFQGYALIATNGPQSKQPMVLFVVLALLLSVQRRMWLAGVATGLATLTWQPALFAAAATALVMALLQPGGWRVRGASVGRFVLGGLLTLAVTVGYFTVVGAVEEFLDGFVVANATHTSQPGFFGGHPRGWDLLTGFLGWSTWPCLLGLALWLPLAGWALRPGKGGAAAERRLRTLALAAGAAGAVGWTLFAYSGNADTMFVLPFAALGLGAATGILLPTVSRWRWSGPVLAAVVSAWVLVAGALTLQTMTSSRTTTLDSMAATTRATFDPLPDDATFFYVDRPQPLALDGGRNLTRYVLYGNGMASWIDAHWPGGREGYIDWVRDREPTVVVTPKKGIGDFLHPLRADYRRVGDAWAWRVFVHRSTHPAVVERMRAAMAEGATGDQ